METTNAEKPRWESMTSLPKTDNRKWLFLKYFCFLSIVIVGLWLLYPLASECVRRSTTQGFLVADDAISKEFKDGAEIFGWDLKPEATSYEIHGRYLKWTVFFFRTQLTVPGTKIHNDYYLVFVYLDRKSNQWCVYRGAGYGVYSPFHATCPANMLDEINYSNDNLDDSVVMDLGNKYVDKVIGQGPHEINHTQIKLTDEGEAKEFAERAKDIIN